MQLLNFILMKDKILAYFSSLSSQILKLLRQLKNSDNVYLVLMIILLLWFILSLCSCDFNRKIQGKSHIYKYDTVYIQYNKIVSPKKYNYGEYFSD